MCNTYFVSKKSSLKKSPNGYITTCLLISAISSSKSPPFKYKIPFASLFLLSVRNLPFTHGQKLFNRVTALETTKSYFSFIVSARACSVLTLVSPNPLATSSTTFIFSRSNQLNEKKPQETK